MQQQLMSTALAVEKRSDKLEKVAALQDKLVNCDTNLTTVEEEVVMEGQMSVQFGATNKVGQRSVILLRCSLLIAVPDSKEERITLEHQILPAECKSVTN